DLLYDAEDLVTESSKNSTAISPDHMIKPMLAVKGTSIFSKPDWIYEIKWDGYRLLANIKKNKVQLYSRNGISYNFKFSPLFKSLKAVPHDVILDGEAVVVDEKGIPDFHKLQNYGEDTEGELRYYVFDMLFLNG